MLPSPQPNVFLCFPPNKSVVFFFFDYSDFSNANLRLDLNVKQWHRQKELQDNKYKSFGFKKYIYVDTHTP